MATSLSPLYNWVYDFFTFFILFSYFVPMSLYVVFEFSRSVQAFFMEVRSLVGSSPRTTWTCMWKTKGE